MDHAIMVQDVTMWDKGFKKYERCVGCMYEYYRAVVAWVVR